MQQYEWVSLSVEWNMTYNVVFNERVITVWSHFIKQNKVF